VMHCSYNWIFALSLAFNLTNLKSRGYPYEELGGQEKSRTTQDRLAGGGGKGRWLAGDGSLPVASGRGNGVGPLQTVAVGDSGWPEVVASDGGLPLAGDAGGWWPATGVRRWWLAGYGHVA
ncbi:Hypothetical predicted protein, partial [Prunus dulcis]